MKRIILGVAAALCLSVGQAAADGLPSRGYIKGPVEAYTPSWNGFYLGAGIGGAALTEDRSFFSGAFSVGGPDASGAFGTVTVGYDRMIHPRWVAGIFADYDFGSGISGDSPAVLFPAPVSVDQNYAWAVGARLGYLLTPSTLVYGTGGYTQTELKYSTFLGGFKQQFDGYFLGAGIETMVRDNWFLKLEYRYANYGSEEATPIPGFIKADPDEQTVRAVVSYKFGDRY